MQCCYTPYLTDLPGVATERAGYAVECPDEARRALRAFHATEQRGVAWRYYDAPSFAEVADRIRRERERSRQQ